MKVLRISCSLPLLLRNAGIDLSYHSRTGRPASISYSREADALKSRFRARSRPPDRRATKGVADPLGVAANARRTASPASGACPSRPRAARWFRRRHSRSRRRGRSLSSGLAARQDLGNVGMLHEAAAGLRPPEFVTPLLNVSRSSGSVHGIERTVSVSASTCSCSARFLRTCQDMTGGVWSMARVKNTADPGTRAILPECNSRDESPRAASARR